MWHGEAALEVLLAREPGEPVTHAALVLRDTLQEPDLISVDASAQRAHLALEAGVLTTALDAAKSVGATSPIEKMLCHQLAAVHAVSMGLLSRFNRVSSRNGTTLITAVVIAVLSYGVGLALSWPHTRRRP